jgi:hypothetical protein
MRRLGDALRTKKCHCHGTSISIRNAGKVLNCPICQLSRTALAFFLDCDMGFPETIWESAMSKHGIWIFALPVIVALSGCCGHGAHAPTVFESAFQKQPPNPKMTPELRAALKLAYGFDDEHITTELPEARQLDAKLRAVGAKFAGDGKMYDRNGKEVYLWSNGPGIGMQIFESELREMQAQRQRALEDARRRYTVIDVGYWGPQPP